MLVGVFQETGMIDAIANLLLNIFIFKLYQSLNYK